MVTEQTAPPRNYLKTGFILVALDTAIHFVSALLDLSGSLLLIRLVSHGVIGVWIGFILNWLHKAGELPSRMPVILYWTAFGGSLLMGSLFSIVAWL